jgi:SAM-dependent MidA family methyltransferase
LLSRTVAEPRYQNNLVTEIATILRQQMEREGPISFAQFMETALYCPGIGYYERADTWIGRRGDFYTSVCVGPLFGQLLAAQFIQWLECEPVGVVQLVEAGAHDGQLAFDILAWLRVEQPGLYERLDYCLLEPSDRRRQWQEQKLDSFAGHVRWASSWKDLPQGSVNGVMFCNELLDAFAVQHLAWDAGSRRWIERGVGIEGDNFVWQRLEVPVCGDLVSALHDAGFDFSPDLLAVLPDGFVIDLSFTAADWWRRAALALNRGRLVTIDYGYTAEEFLRPDRREGTLRAYSRHHVSSDVFTNPGERDITAHVNFSQLRMVGERAGLSSEEVLSQAQFLTRIAECEWQRQPPSPAEIRQFQSLTHPEHLGRAFRVLVQSRRIASLPG